MGTIITKNQIEKLENVKFDSLKIEGSKNLINHFSDNWNGTVKMCRKSFDKRNGEVKDHFYSRVEKMINIIDNGGTLENLEDIFNY